MSQLFASGDQSIGASASASVFPMNIQGRFPLGLTGLSCSPRDSQESSPAPQFESINFLALTLVQYWKNHSFDHIDFCWQSDISAFLIRYLGLS